MSEELPNRAQIFDVIEIIPSHYMPEHPIGNRYVVIGSLNDFGLDVEIINEKGEYATVCWEDYKIIGNANDMRTKHWDEVKKRQAEIINKARSDENE